MIKLKNLLENNLVLVVGSTILLFVVFAVIAPIAAHFGLEFIARPIYWVFQFLCHQRPWRSIHLFDHQLAFCARDTFIYLGMGLSAYIVHWKKLKSLKWYWLILFTLPIAADGIIQTVAEIKSISNGDPVFFYASTNLVRALTGALFGAGVGFFVFGLLQETLYEEKGRKLPKQSWHCSVLWTVALFVFLAIVYVGAVQVWRITSPKYPPHGYFDHIRLFPGVNYEDVERAGHGCVKAKCQV